MSSSDFAVEQLKHRTRIFPNRAVDHSWESIVRTIYDARPDLDSSRNLFIRVNNGLGDVVCTLGLMRAWKQHYGARHVIGIVNRSTAEVRSLFPSALDHVLEVDAEPTCGEYRGRSIFGVLHRPTKPYIFSGLLEPWFTRLQVPYLDRYRLGLQLPPWSQFEPPTIDPAPELIDSSIVQNLCGGVLIAPFARTIPGPSRVAWSRLVEQLSQTGLRVFTNMTNTVNTAAARIQRDTLDTTQPIEGSEAVHCNLATLLAAAPGLRACVTTNSGVAWLVAHAASKLIVLHPHVTLPTFEHNRHGFTASALIEIDSIRRSFPWASQVIDLPVDQYFPSTVVAAIS